jgi:L-ascorbate metabolism protein UlaG (beta-lactamase superfamily)
MFISWHGLSSFKIQEKETILLTDPYSKETGLNPPRASNADIITLSRDSLKKNLKNLKENALIINGPGEYEAKNIMINGIESSYSKEGGLNTVYTIKISEVTLCHLGTLDKELTDDELDKIDGVDVLFVPIGGGESIGIEQSVKIINEIEPRIVIPMYYKIPKLKQKLESIDKFSKEMGVGKNNIVPKLNIKKNKLPQEETQVVLLSPLG